MSHAMPKAVVKKHYELLLTKAPPKHLLVNFPIDELEDDEFLELQDHCANNVRHPWMTGFSVIKCVEEFNEGSIQNSHRIDQSLYDMDKLRDQVIHRYSMLAERYGHNNLEGKLREIYRDKEGSAPPLEEALDKAEILLEKDKKAENKEKEEVYEQRLMLLRYILFLFAAGGTAFIVGDHPFIDVTVAAIFSGGAYVLNLLLHEYEKGKEN